MKSLSKNRQREIANYVIETAGRADISRLAELTTEAARINGTSVETILYLHQAEHNTVARFGVSAAVAEILGVTFVFANFPTE